MKLNPDCVREVLIWLEKNQRIDVLSGRLEAILTVHLPDKINSFSAEDVVYATKQMAENGLLKTRSVGVDDSDACWIEDISPKGHEFLENIRNDTNWNKVKEGAAKTGSFALSALEKIATAVVAAAIKSQIGI